MSYKVRNVNYGWCIRKHDILLSNLPPSKEKLLRNTKFFRWMKGNAAAVEVIFKIEDMCNHEKNLKRFLWNPYVETFTTLKDLESDCNLVEWDCAICKNEIKSRMDSKKLENFVCSKCKESHNSSNKVVDSRIIHSSQKFNTHCKTLLTNEQKELLKYDKKSSKR